MIVTDKQYSMESRLVEKLDLMIKRMDGRGTDDNVVLISGDEGQGKSTLAAQICYYISYKTGRQFNLDNVFFDLDKLTTHAIHKSDSILDWDEGALGGLASEWWQKNQIRLLKLLMVCRKKRHFIVICIPKFFKLNEYLVVDRSVALLHVYSKGNIHKGRFIYFNKKSKENLYQEWRSTKRRSYAKYKTFGGSFPSMFGELIDKDGYESKKDEGIMSLDSKGKPAAKEDLVQKRYDEFRWKIAQLVMMKKIKRQDLVRYAGINNGRIANWLEIGKKRGFTLENMGFMVSQSANLLNKGADGNKINFEPWNEAMEEENYEEVPQNNTNIAEDPEDELTAGTD